MGSHIFECHGRSNGTSTCMGKYLVNDSSGQSMPKLWSGSATNVLGWCFTMLLELEVTLNSISIVMQLSQGRVMVLVPGITLVTENFLNSGK